MEVATIAIRAVVVVDMVESTALRDRLGDNRADRLRRDHYDLLRSAIAEHGGRVLNFTGDGVQADFATASDAVSAALDVRRAVDRYGRQDGSIAPFQVRIGVSVGEVVMEADDDSGLAVIEAVRLEAMCRSGEILVTALVEQLGRRRVDATFEEAGERRLRGLDRPVMAFRVLDPRSTGSSRSLPKALSLDRRFPLVGRSEALAVAAQGWQQACSGVAGAVLLTGQSGMGKSRLLAQIADRAHLQGAAVLVGVCDADLMVPYHPFAMAFHDAAADDPVIAAALADGDGPLGPMFANRRRARPDEQGPSARYELFDAVAELIRRLSERRPLLFVLDDLHWATESTVQLLRHLVAHTRDAPVLLIATYRAEEVTVGHPLHGLLAELGSSERVRRVALSALSETDVVEMITANVPGAGRTEALEFARRVSGESAGSPFFISELLHHLSATGELQRILRDGDYSKLPIPESVKEVVGQRLARLSDGARELLAMASIIGLTFDIELIAELLGRPSVTVLDTVEEVIRATLVHEIGIGRFAFSHAIVRSTIVEPMSSTRRALVSRSIAEALETLQREDHDDLARHWELAGDAPKAMAYLERAAQRDLEALAYESAADRFRVVLDHHRSDARSDPGAIARAALGLGLAERGLGVPDYGRLVEVAGRYARGVRDADLMADAALASLWPGTFFLVAGRVDPFCVELCEDALATLPADDQRRVGLLSTLAGHLTFDRDRDRRAALLREALTRAQEVGDPKVIGGVLVSEYLALWDPSTFERRAAIATELSRMARAADDVTLEFFAKFFTAIGATERGAIDDAREALAGLESTALAARNFYFTFLAERLSVSLDIFLGVHGAQARVDDLANRYASTHADTDGTWAIQTAGLSMHHGTMHTMVGGMRFIMTGSNFAPSWLPAYGLALLAGGELDEANAVLDSCFEEPLLDYFWLTSFQAQAELAVELDRVERCSELYEMLLPYAPQLGVTTSGSLCFAFVSTTLGLLALACRDLPAAIGHLEHSIRRADEIGAPFESVKSRRALAEALLLSGEAWAGVEPLVDAASSVAREHGFLGEEARLLLVRQGRRRPNPPS